MTRRPARRRQGFVMPAVLTVVAVVTLVFLVVILSLDSLTEEARSAREDIRFREAALTAEAEVAWLMSTEPLSEQAIAIGRRRASLEETYGSGVADLGVPTAELRLDGRPYRLPDGPIPGTALTVQVQDGGGLANLNTLDPIQARRFFEVLGLPQSEAARFADRLTDYLDADDFRQPSGAEIDDYVREGAGRPQNGGLSRVEEISGLLGFHEAVERGRFRALRDHLTADPTTFAFNINTMTPEAMVILFGAAPERAVAAAERRAAGPFTTFAEFAAVAGVPDTSSYEVSTTFPTGRVALKALDRRRGIAYRSRITVSPSDREKPVWVEDRSFTPMTAAERRTEPADAEPFPVAAP